MSLSAMLFAAWMLAPTGMAENDAASRSVGYAEIHAARLVDSQRSNARRAAPSAEEIREELSLAAQIIRDQVPIRSEAATITGARAQGYELVTTMEIDLELDESTLAILRREMNNQLCATEALVRLVRAGATISYEVTDTSRRMYKIELRHCDGN